MGQGQSHNMENASVQVFLHCLYPGGGVGGMGWVEGCLCCRGSAMSSLNHAFYVQSHTCGRVAGKHIPGIQCLPDEMVINLLVRLDCDTTLLNIGQLGNERLREALVKKKRVKKQTLSA